jgi:hypothetical protein
MTDDTWRIRAEWHGDTATPGRRWAQLTYTSVAAGESLLNGGWQFKQSGTCTDAERARVLTRIPTHLSMPRPLPRYASDLEVALAPRRLAFVEDDAADSVTFLVHTAPAGHDATGRPGNVFTHVLLDRTLTEALGRPDPTRPIEFWRSPQWLAPFGPASVQDAWCDDRRQFERGPTVNRDSIVDFLFDGQCDRVNRLADLLDATAAAMIGGPRVVLVVDNIDEGAMWIGLVSFLAAPASAARLSFSTYERAGEILSHGSLSLLCVVLSSDFHDPHADHPAAANVQSKLLFLDLSQQIDNSAPAGQEAQERFGPRPTPCEWSELAVDLYNAGDVLLDDRLLDMDAIRGSHPGTESCPWWAFALAVAREPRLRESWPVAAAVLLRETPDDMDVDKDLAMTIRETIRQAADPGAAGIWELVSAQGSRISGNPGILAVIVDVFLERALANGGAQTPTEPSSAGSLSEAPANGAVRIRAIDIHGRRWLGIALRFVDLLVRAGTADDQLPDTVHGLIADINMQLAQSGGGAALDRIGPLDERTVQLLQTSAAGVFQ